MQGQFYIANSDATLANTQAYIADEFSKHKYIRVKVDGGKRTLPQNSLKSVWYGEIAKHRGDVTAKEVENECKLNYGIPILRRDPANNWIYENSLDKLDYERKLKVMTRFAVTSIMSVQELSEYCGMMQADYPFLSSKF